MATGIKIFNTSLEVGLRLLFLLASLVDKSCGIERLVYYDYILTYSGDIEKAPESLHPSSPFRAEELIEKRKVIQEALELMIHKKLIKVVFDENGITYSSNQLTPLFVRYFQSDYSKKLQERIEWLIKTFRKCLKSIKK